MDVAPLPLATRRDGRGDSTIRQPPLQTEPVRDAAEQDRAARCCCRGNLLAAALVLGAIGGIGWMFGLFLAPSAPPPPTRVATIAREPSERSDRPDQTSVASPPLLPGGPDTARPLNARPPEPIRLADYEAAVNGLVQNGAPPRVERPAAPVVVAATTPIWNSSAMPSAPGGLALLPAGDSQSALAPANPSVLRPPLTDVHVAEEAAGLLQFPAPGYLLRMPIEPPLGFAGRSRVAPTEGQTSDDFVPLPDRWRSGFPDWDRYDKDHPRQDDYPFVEGAPLNSYTQNVLKGDYPIFGQHTFLNFTGEMETVAETRQLPTPAGSFESTAGPGQSEFFGNPNQFVMQENFRATFDLFHGEAAFSPVDWRVRLQPVFNMNYLDVHELGIVGPDVTDGTQRFRDYFALEQWFVEKRLFDTSPEFDFISARIGSQPFVSDFRGFIFDDTNRAVRIFGTRFNNQDQFNVAFFDQQEKNTDSELNTFADRGQRVVIANYFHQDFLFPGYTAELSLHYDHEDAAVHYDDNGFIVRPDPAGIAFPHLEDIGYLGIAGDGHIGGVNVSDAVYWAFGRDALNPMAGQPVTISAQMAALELSYDRDWVRFRISGFYASGDSNPSDNRATGFDTILDDPNFAGGEFSFWNRQPIKLQGVNLKQANSLVPDLRAAKSEGQANFVNPGLMLANFGMDFELTQKLRLISNVNLLWFDQTEVLDQFVFQAGIHRHIGTDISLGTEYRPWLNNNCILRAGVSALVPGQGFEDLYDPLVGTVGTMFASFVDFKLTY